MTTTVGNPPYTFIGLGGAGKKLLADVKELLEVEATFVAFDDDSMTTIEDEPLFQESSSIFLLAGLGGTFGTEQMLVLARKAKEANKTVTVCATVPFSFEGRSKTTKSLEAVKTLQQLVDSTIILHNDELFTKFGNQEPMHKVFKEGNRLLAERLQEVLA